MKISATVLQGVCLAIEKTINRALEYDPATRQKMHSLTGSVLCIQATQPEWEVCFFPLKDSCRIQTHYSGEPDITIKGATQDLLLLALKPGHSLANTRASASGKISLLNEYQAIFSGLDIDWETALAEKLGATPANLIASVLRAGKQHIEQSSSKVKTLVPELITEEWALSPSRFEFDAFCQDVSELRRDTERLEAKLKLLGHRAGDDAGTTH